MKLPTKRYALLVLAATAPWILRADPVTDQRIEDAARNTYNFHTVLQDRVKIEAKDGVVTLSGSVQDPDQKKLAEDTVNQVPGVRKVHDELTVESPGPENSDGWIAFKIRSMLLVKPNVSSSDTHVDVKDGVVTLAGTAETKAQKELTETYVKDIQGVKSVDDDIKVTGESYTDTHGRTMTASGMDDASITAQVKWALTTHGSTSAIKTKVRTDNGVVTISGDANSDAEKDLVTRLAEDVRGVRSVDNQMTVR